MKKAEPLVRIRCYGFFIWLYTQVADFLNRMCGNLSVFGQLNLLKINVKFVLSDVINAGQNRSPGFQMEQRGPPGAGEPLVKKGYWCAVVCIVLISTRFSSRAFT